METEMEIKNLVRALENATAMAKQLQSTTTTTTDSANIYASLHAAHRHLSLFLSQSPPPPPASADVTDDVDEPMPIADEDHQQPIDGATEMITVETMEERMKDFSIQNNKRLKRTLSPTTLTEIEAARARFEYDPYVNRLRALDLIYQFHS